ncbi:MAG: sigma-70 family RNA polymerase sigma factor [Clostridia bacterium]|nr:sigma-70 family RNA polymerase sigma factor [Clostridia bacterium]
MITVDKNDALYAYLTKLGVEDVEATYTHLASLGIYHTKDVQAYYQENFRPSLTDDFEEAELERVVDYYADLKKVKAIPKTKLADLLKNYYETKDEHCKEKIINAELKDVLYMCLNYNSKHKDTDVQDLVQIANIGLITALNKFNPNNKIDFKDYVVYWISQKIKEEFEEKNNG